MRASCFAYSLSGLDRLFRKGTVGKNKAGIAHADQVAFRSMPTHFRMETDRVPTAGRGFIHFCRKWG
jgi:hypothetical protein